MNLFDSDEVKKRVDKVWERVFLNCNSVLRQSKIYGFYCCQEVPHPNMHALIVHLNIFSAVMNILVTQGMETGVDYDQTRLILNAKEQLTKMERVAAAITANNKKDYQMAIQDMEKKTSLKLAPLLITDKLLLLESKKRSAIDRSD
ncbi:hypothetical protein [Candidatus Nitrotoga arctica]|uniref:Uncharacterized protein n=1 Tax=Candidatus Nitrotoga arctica TaxID=453162 RepID=A0ABM8Z1E9_9PROT|nr:hypothetical protein [Candidatus Nitrotoga arctica]CAG9933673.1 conserved protein of unknown function [Candidatus Nitrotoga arctica]